MQYAEVTGESSPVNHGVRNLNLTRTNLVGIFNGTIQYWNDPSLVEDNPGLETVNERIIVVVRKDAAGATSIFTRALASFTANWTTRFESFYDGRNIPILVRI